MKKIIILPDAHINTNIPKPYQVVKKFIKEFKPDEAILLGDFMDVSALSSWDMDKKRLIEGQRYQKEIDVANNELDYLQKYCNKVTYLEGNHETRVERYLDKNAELEGMLEIPKLLNLKARNIKWVKYNDLYQLGKLYCTHGYYCNQYYTKKTLDVYGCNIVVGHLHKPQTSFTTAKMSEAKMCWGLGCLCGHDAPYLKGRPSNWDNGFAVVYLDEKTGHFTLYPVGMSRRGSFIWNGKRYE